MPTTKKGSTKKTEAEELDALAHHISETLRILRTSEHFTARLYNDFADAWNEVCNSAVGLGHLWDSEAYARLVLAELAKKGGAE